MKTLTRIKTTCRIERISTYSACRVWYDGDLPETTVRLYVARDFAGWDVFPGSHQVVKDVTKYLRLINEG